MRTRVMLPVVLLVLVGLYLLWPTDKIHFTHVHQILLDADELELVSLDPKKTDEHPDTGKDEPGVERLRHYIVLGRTHITDPKIRRELLDALARGVAEYDGVSSACFDPRHALTARKGDQVVDLLICFHCRNTHGYGSLGDFYFAQSESPEPVFDAVLQKAGIPLAAKAP